MNTATKMTRAAIYGRKSTEDERTSEDGRSVDRQVELARAFVARQGWVVAEGCVESDERSGADFTRPGLLRMLRAATAGKFDALVVMAIDRIGREQVGLANAMRALRAARVAVWTYQDGQEVKFGTPTEKLMFGVNSFAAEEYRHAIKLKTAEALRAKAARGHVVGARTYGYQLVRVGDHAERVIDPEQGAVVKRIFQMSVEGHGDMRIVNRLSADHVPGPGRGWTKTTVRRILRNRIYAGEQVYGLTANVDDGGRGKRVRVADPSAWIVASVPHLRIIDSRTWERVQARKAKTRAHYLRAPDGKLLGKPESGLVAARILSGIARCGACGSAMVHMGGGRKNRYYCLQRNRRGPAGCSMAHGAPMRELDAAVLEKLYDTLVNKPEVVAELCEARVARARSEQTGSKRPSVERQIKQLEAEVRRLVDLLATGRAKADLTAAVEERRARIESLRAEVVAEPVSFDRAAFFEGVRALSGLWAVSPLVNHNNPVLVRQVLRRLGVDRVVVHREPDGSWSFESALDAGRVVAYTPGLPTRAARPSWR